ncbi:Uncharacterised protein [Mycobacteroides abscessus subsp. abscessus]|nr:Uncharacterised protein [Mycobacteroides abscessus subsp. abscessus]SKV04207.1 Uncharacterised protein [Mycobacteroides abscessus subsp. abscessus]
MIHARVDLPEPLPPHSSIPSPESTRKETSRSTGCDHGVPTA